MGIVMGDFVGVESALSKNDIELICTRYAFEKRLFALKKELADYENLPDDEKAFDSKEALQEAIFKAESVLPQIDFSDLILLYELKSLRLPFLSSRISDLYVANQSYHQIRQEFSKDLDEATKIRLLKIFSKLSPSSFSLEPIQN